KNSTPKRTPTVATEAGGNRKTTQERTSQAMPVSRNIHQGPASRHSAARVLDRMAVRSSMGLMGGFLSHRWLSCRDPAAGGLFAWLISYPFWERMTPGQGVGVIRRRPVPLPHMSQAPAGLRLIWPAGPWHLRGA